MEKKATVDDRNPTANKQLAAPPVPVPYGLTTHYHSCGSVLAFRSLLTLCAELRVAPLLKLFCQVQQSHYRPSESRARLCLAWASAWLGLGLAWLIGEPIRSPSLVTGSQHGAVLLGSSDSAHKTTCVVYLVDAKTEGCRCATCNIQRTIQHVCCATCNVHLSCLRCLPCRPRKFWSRHLYSSTALTAVWPYNVVQHSLCRHAP